MKISQMLLPEFDQEMKKTRTTLERVPEDKADYKPHEKSAPFGRLAVHVARLPEYAATILNQPGLEISEQKQKPRALESRQHLLAEFDAGAQQARDAISAANDEQWEQNWKFTFQGKPISDVSRLQTYRFFFLNHLIHHRAQLGMYLRLNDVPVPATYGPSADDTMGF